MERSGCHTSFEIANREKGSLSYSMVHRAFGDPRAEDSLLSLALALTVEQPVRVQKRPLGIRLDKRDNSPSSAFSNRMTMQVHLRPQPLREHFVQAPLCGAVVA